MNIYQAGETLPWCAIAQGCFLWSWRLASTHIIRPAKRRITALDGIRDAMLTLESLNGVFCDDQACIGD